MASQLTRHRSRIVAYLPNLRTVVRHFRAFSSYDEQTPDVQYIQVNRTDGAETKPWPDAKLGPLNPKNKSCPLPGNVGIAEEKEEVGVAKVQLPAMERLGDVMNAPTQQERQMSILQQFNMAQAEIEQQELGYEVLPSPLDHLECVVQDCPQMLKKDFQELFPNRNLLTSDLTVITISQKTDSDMTAWSQSVEEEREVLLQHFIAGAKEICSMLSNAGYWADFIDPSSGRPYHGAFTNATFFETDERYRKFGFEINDLGCCKVISHHLWGTKAYVGCLFTNTPTDHPMMQIILNTPDSEMDD